MIINSSDERLYALCKRYGEQARFWRQKFIGLLPEVYRRRLYEKKNFSSIFEFAKKLCGLSEEQVRLALNLEKRFEDKPMLKSLLTNGEVSINKLARVVSIATPENEEELAEKIKILPQKALETLVRDEKILAANDLGPGDVLNSMTSKFGQYQGQRDQNGLQISFFEAKSLRAQTFTAEANLNFKLDDDVVKQLNDLNAKGINVSAILREMLQKRSAEIEQTKKQISAEINGKAVPAEFKAATMQDQSASAELNVETVQDQPVSTESHPVQPRKSRYIPVEIKKILKQEFGEKCSITTCKKPATTIHHAQRFGLVSTHDPKYLAPFCREHHAIAHSIDINYQRLAMPVP